MKDNAMKNVNKNLVNHHSLLAFTIEEAATVSRTSRSSIYEALRRKELVGKKAGRRTLIMRADLDNYLSRLPNYGHADNSSEQPHD